MNTPESSPSGNIHGMPLAAIIGYGAPELVELFGYKPKIEPRNVRAGGACAIWTPRNAASSRIPVSMSLRCATSDERPACANVMSEALRFVTDDTDGAAVGLDMDFVDPTDAPGVGTLQFPVASPLSRSPSGNGNDC